MAVEVGSIYETLNFGPVEVIKYVSSREVYVRFSDGTETRTWSSQIRSGRVRNPNKGRVGVKKRTTQEEAINNLVKTHGDTYDYTDAVYTSATEPIYIKCKIHGEFKQIYSYHRSGRGCNKCARERTTEAIRKRADNTTESVVADLIGVHGDEYDYKDVVYTDSVTKLKINCRKHGPFFQVYKVHAKGHGCPSCSAERASVNQTYSQEKYLELCSAKDIDKKYDYSETVYTGMNNRLTVVCKTHGPFSILAKTHLTSGAGCPECNGIGFNYEKPARLYVIKSHDLLKVGITNREVETRIKEISAESGVIFEIVTCNYFEIGRDCYKIERICLDFLRSKYRNPAEKFTGYSECFIGVDKEEFLEFLYSSVCIKGIALVCK